MHWPIQPCLWTIHQNCGSSACEYWTAEAANVLSPTALGVVRNCLPVYATSGLMAWSGSVWILTAMRYPLNLRMNDGTQNSSDQALLRHLIKAADIAAGTKRNESGRTAEESALLVQNKTIIRAHQYDPNGNAKESTESDWSGTTALKRKTTYIRRIRPSAGRWRLTPVGSHD